MDRLFGRENSLAPRQHRMAERGEFGTAVIQGRHVHGPQHPVGHIGGAWNLKKMPSSVHGHMASFPGYLRWRRPDTIFWRACPHDWPAEKGHHASFSRSTNPDPAIAGRPPMERVTASSKGCSGWIRKALKPPSTSSAMDIRKGKCQLPVASMTNPATQPPNT